MPILPTFDADGLLPPGDYELSFKDLRASQLVPDHVRSDFRCQRKRKSHKSKDFTERLSWCQ